MDRNWLVTVSFAVFLAGVPFGLRGQETGSVASSTGDSIIGSETAADPAGEINTAITESATGQAVELSQFVDELIRHDVVFLGEQHTNQSGHDFQLQVIRALREKGAAVVISTEQFERDVQGALDDYLAGRISEDEFLKHSRPWKNYEPHYKPIVEFAKANSIPVLAANTPGPISSLVSKGDSVPLASRALLPRNTSAPEDEYWQYFVNSMKGHVGADGTDQLKKFYAAQCLKDDAMAETITDYLTRNRHQRKLVVHLCGHFHSDYGLGTVARVQQRMPLLKTCVVTMQEMPKDGIEGIQTDKSRANQRAHFVFWTATGAEK